MRGVALVLLPWLVGNCTTNAGGHQAGEALAPSASSAARAPSSAAAPASKSSTADEPAEAFRQAMRTLDWESAASLFDRLSPEQKDEPEFRFARAYAAHELGDHETVLRLTEGLDEKLVVLKPELTRLRAEAALKAGKHDRAVEYFAKQSSPEDLLKAARAEVAQSKFDSARQLTDRALNIAAKQKGSHELVAEIRAERVQIASQRKQTALMALDLRWLALSATTTEPALGADQKLEQLKGQILSKQQRYERALAFANVGRIEDTEAELELLTKAPGPAIRKGDLLHVRAVSYYSNRSYAKAAELFDQAIAAGTRYTLNDSFHAARALSRADRDLQAIERYKKFVQSYPQSGLAEDARYNIGRLYYILGRWDEAATGYNKYLGNYAKRGRFQKTARYELAVTRLVQKQYDKALTGFGRLLKEEDSPRLKARYQLLEAIALAGIDKKEAAIEQLQQIANENPLSFQALAARQRLRLLGVDPPPPMPAPESVEPVPPLGVELPAKVSLFARAGLDQLAEEELEEHEDTLRARYRPREYESLCLAYSRLSGAARRYQVGQRAARWSLLTKPPNPNTRWLWDCVYPRPYPQLVKQAETEYQLPSHLMYAVMRQESGFRPRVVSPAKAVGLMQLIEPTAQRVSSELKEPYDQAHLGVPRHNLRYGAFYLRRLLDTFGNNVVLATAAYNAGPIAVSHWLETGEHLDLDLFVARIPYGETRGYVERVVENLARYGYLEGGNTSVPELDLKIPSGLRADADAY